MPIAKVRLLKSFGDVEHYGEGEFHQGFAHPPRLPRADSRRDTFMGMTEHGCNLARP